jgi:hypothetical protein
MLCWRGMPVCMWEMLASSLCACNVCQWSQHARLPRNTLPVAHPSHAVFIWNRVPRAVHTAPAHLPHSSVYALRCMCCHTTQMSCIPPTTTVTCDIMYCSHVPHADHVDAELSWLLFGKDGIEPTYVCVDTVVCVPRAACIEAAYLPRSCHKTQTQFAPHPPPHHVLLTTGWPR